MANANKYKELLQRLKTAEEEVKTATGKEKEKLEAEIEDKKEKVEFVERMTQDEYLLFLRRAIAGKHGYDSCIMDFKGEIDETLSTRVVQLEQFLFDTRDRMITCILPKASVHEHLSERMNQTEILDYGTKSKKVEETVCEDMLIDFNVLCSQKLEDLENGQMRDWTYYITPRNQEAE